MFTMVQAWWHKMVCFLTQRCILPKRNGVRGGMDIFGGEVLSMREKLLGTVKSIKTFIDFYKKVVPIRHLCQNFNH